MVVMIVAITTVHIGNGFLASDNGFEIPLYYLLFLLIFLSHGAGKYSFGYPPEDQITFSLSRCGFCRIVSFLIFYIFRVLFFLYIINKVRQHYEKNSVSFPLSPRNIRHGSG